MKITLSNREKDAIVAVAKAPVIGPVVSTVIGVPLYAFSLIRLRMKGEI
jgi:hypothetical protein